jgi:hypothetical protein
MNKRHHSKLHCFLLRLAMPRRLDRQQMSKCALVKQAKFDTPLTGVVGSLRAHETNVCVRTTAYGEPFLTQGMQILHDLDPLFCPVADDAAVSTTKLRRTTSLLAMMILK